MNDQIKILQTKDKMISDLQDERKTLEGQIQKTNVDRASTKRKMDEMTNKFEEEEKSLTAAYTKLAYF